MLLLQQHYLTACATMDTYGLEDLPFHIGRQSAFFTSAIYPSVRSKCPHFLVHKLPVDGPQVCILPISYYHNKNNNNGGYFHWSVILTCAAQL